MTEVSEAELAGLERCEYVTDLKSCREPRAGSIRFDDIEHPLCERHLKPVHHPADLHAKLAKDTK